MLRKSLAFGLVAALAAVLAATALARRDSTPKLTGSDGPGFTINLKSNGKAVKIVEGRQLQGRHQRPLLDPRLVSGRPARVRQGHRPGRRHRHEDRDAQAQGREVQVLLPGARVDHVRALHRQVDTRPRGRQQPPPRIDRRCASTEAVRSASKAVWQLSMSRRVRLRSAAVRPGAISSARSRSPVAPRCRGTRIRARWSLSWSAAACKRRTRGSRTRRAERR